MAKKEVEFWGDSEEAGERGTDEPDGSNAVSRVRKNERRRETGGGVGGRMGTRIIEDEFPSLRG